MKELLIERGRIELARRECLDRERWRLFCCGHLLEAGFQRERDVKNYREIDR